MKCVVIVAASVILFSPASLGQAISQPLPEIDHEVFADWSQGYHEKCLGQYTVGFCGCTAQYFAEDANNGRIDHLAEPYNKDRLYARYVSERQCRDFKQLTPNTLARTSTVAETSPDLTTPADEEKAYTEMTEEERIQEYKEMGLDPIHYDQQAQDDFLADVMKDIDEAVEENERPPER